MSDERDRKDGSDPAHEALQQRAEQLGATVEELSAALEALALQTEVVLRRLRGESTH